eukprot:COSAG04_NODE_540_length_12878_cov_10.484858_4_plen_330_part_00
MRAHAPVEGAPLRIATGPPLTSAARVEELAALLRSAEAEQPKAPAAAAKKKKKQTKGKGGASKAAASAHAAVHTVRCGEEDSAAGIESLPSPDSAVGRAVKVKLDDDKWHPGRVGRRSADGETVAIELDFSKRKDLLRDWTLDDPQLQLLPAEDGALHPAPLAPEAFEATAQRRAFDKFCKDYENVARQAPAEAPTALRLREMWAILPPERKQACVAAPSVRCPGCVARSAHCWCVLRQVPAHRDTGGQRRAAAARRVPHRVRHAHAGGQNLQAGSPAGRGVRHSSSSESRRQAGRCVPRRARVLPSAQCGDRPHPRRPGSRRLGVSAR